MITLSPQKIFEKLKGEKRRSLLFTNYKIPTPNEIRSEVQNLRACPKCQFLIFDNYWTDEIENKQNKVCPTCGEKL